MASEGLDIPTMNAEFLITPKTDVVQTVGRVLRAKHWYQDPIIYDIIDTHEPFKRQWLKRKRFYKSQNYRINKADMTQYRNYKNLSIKWVTDYEPKNWDDCTKPTTNKIIKKTNSRSSTERSITTDDEDEVEEEETKPVGKCLLKFKK
jgi:superfamily II DNA or RNA helicase